MTTDWLYRIRPTRIAMLSDGPTQEEGAAMAAHFQYLKGLTEQGVVVLAGPTLVLDDSNFGIVVFHAEDEAAAQAIMQADPAVQAGVMHADLFPFKVSLLGSAPASD